MSSPNAWPGGLNGTGPDLAELENDFFSGEVVWVDTNGGSNSNSGAIRELPKATLASAVAAVGPNGLIVIEAGSSEVISSAVTFSDAFVTVLGLGAGSTAPRYTNAQSASNMFSVAAAGVRFQNLYFPASTVQATDARIKTVAAHTSVVDCYFECGGYDITHSLAIIAGGTQAYVSGCTFAVTSQTPAQPHVGLELTTPVDCTIEDCTFNGGSYGWADYALKVSDAATRVRIVRPTLINESNIGFTITGTSYQIYGVSATGSSRVVIAA